MIYGPGRNLSEHAGGDSELPFGNLSAMEKSISRIINDELDDPELRDQLYTTIAEIEKSGDPKSVKKAKRHRQRLEDLDRRRPISQPESGS
jgi:hypothetical protein